MALEVSDKEGSQKENEMMLPPEGVVTYVLKMIGLVSLGAPFLPSCNDSPRTTNESWELSSLAVSDLLSVPSVMLGGNYLD